MVGYKLTSSYRITATVLGNGARSRSGKELGYYIDRVGVRRF
jgi:hypothetical protein